MVQRVYLDTSVIGGCLDPEFSLWSKALFHEFDLRKKTAVISDLTLTELEFAPKAVRELIEHIPDYARKW